MITPSIIREFELEIQHQFNSGIIKGTVHLSIGQEIIDTNIIQFFYNPLVFGNHRSHGQYLATTEDIIGLYKQIIDNKTQHLYYPDKFLSTGIQGALCPVAVGNAMGFKLKKINRKVLCFIGDGTLGQGIFYESLNFASIYKLNISFVIIDNNYSMSLTMGKLNLKSLANSFNVNYEEFGDNYSDDSTSIIYAPCQRLCGHSCNDTQAYRSKSEILIDNLQINSDESERDKQFIKKIIGR